MRLVSTEVPHLKKKKLPLIVTPGDATHDLTGLPSTWLLRSNLGFNAASLMQAFNGTAEYTVWVVSRP